MKKSQSILVLICVILLAYSFAFASLPSVIPIVPGGDEIREMRTTNKRFYIYLAPDNKTKKAYASILMRKQQSLLKNRGWNNIQMTKDPNNDTFYIIKADHNEKKIGLEIEIYDALNSMEVGIDYAWEKK